jgi:hypothetical protein
MAQRKTPMETNESWNAIYARRGDVCGINPHLLAHVGVVL